MAVKKVSTIQRFIGLSTDTKPTGVSPGSTFYAYDAGVMLITRDGTNWVFKDRDMIGPIALRTNGEGTASWSKIGDNNSQLRYSDWTALLNGGTQAGSDWAAVHIPIDDLSVPEFNEFIYKYYLAEAQAAGLAICLATYNPDDHSERAEISQTAGVPPSETGWNFYTINPETQSLFWYGNNVDSDLTEGAPYTWAEFQADKAFKNHVIYMIKLEQGYWGEGTAGDCWVPGAKLNGINIPIEPSVSEQLVMLKESIDALVEALS